MRFFILDHRVAGVPIIDRLFEHVYVQEGILIAIALRWKERYEIYISV